MCPNQAHAIYTDRSHSLKIRNEKNKRNCK